jgi:hypothetical protein
MEFIMRNLIVSSFASAASLVLLGLLTPGIAAQDHFAPPAPAEVVPDGTRFLVRLDAELSSQKDKVNRKFRVVTLDPLQTPGGYVLPPGAKIRGHISRVERGGIASRPGLWLTFDDIGTRHGRVPIIAEVIDVPGDFAVRPGERKNEGEIEARARRTQELEAAAGAALGAAAGSSGHGTVGAAVGGAAGGAAGYNAGKGQEVDLPRGTKLELVLNHPLYLYQ